MFTRAVLAALFTCVAAQPALCADGIAYVLAEPQVAQVVYPATAVARIGTTYGAPVIQTPVYQSQVIQTPVYQNQVVNWYGNSTGYAYTHNGYTYGAPVVQLPMTYPAPTQLIQAPAIQTQVSYPVYGAPVATFLVR